VPIGPALPEGQAPPYAIQQVKESSAVPPRWALCKFKHVHRDQAHKLPPILAPLPMPPPHPVGAAAPRQTTERTSSSTTLPDSSTPTQAASRTDLTTIAIHPWPVEFETDSPTSEIAKIRSQYGKSTECDKVLVAFSKKLFIILRHDTSQHNVPWITCVDKSRWPHGIVWPIDDFCKYLGKIFNFTKNFAAGEFRDVFFRCMLDCEKYLINNLKVSDWDYVGIPKPYAFKWLAICAFERPRIAKLCFTKYETFHKGTSETKSTRIVIDKVVGISAFQGHTYGESANNYQVLGWHKVTQAFTGNYIFFGFH
jgi:hypothetical protein